MRATDVIQCLALIAATVAALGTSTAQASPARLRVMHWNVRGYHRDVPVPPRPDGSRSAVTHLSLGPFSAARAASVVRTQAADVVGFDELCRGQLRDVRHRLVRLGYRYSRHVSGDHRTRCRLGVGILSRLPIVAEKTMRLRRWLSPPDGFMQGETAPANNYLKGIAVMARGQPVWVWEWHSTTVTQTPDVAGILTNGPPTSVAMCDCNRDSRVQHGWAWGMMDALGPFAWGGFREVDGAWKWTRGSPLPGVAHPAYHATFGNYVVVDDGKRAPFIAHRTPRHKKDYIFVRSPAGAVIDRVRTPQTWLSDHVPLLADVYLP